MPNAKLFDALAARGWAMRDGSLLAPQESMWLEEGLDWDTQTFLENMRRRKRRIASSRVVVGEESYDSSFADVCSAIEAAEAALGV